MANEVRMGVIGIGNMGSDHAKWILEGKVKRCRLAAICDVDSGKFGKFPGVEPFTDSRKLLRSGKVDAVIIATPHYFHTTIGIDAFGNGIHVLTEKPISVHKKDCERLIAAHRKSRGLKFSAMFMMRTEKIYRRFKEIVGGGTLGRIQRVNLVKTDWFRTEAYYSSGGWRATWAGEGGGVLMNQAPHNLDLFQWICGMPSRVRAKCHLGRHHDIEVEDEVAAYLEYPNGATGVFITTTGEAPGTSRWEVAGTKGKAVLEGYDIKLAINDTPADEFSRSSVESFGSPKKEQSVENFVYDTEWGDGHNAVTQSLVDAILDGSPLLVEGAEGIRSVELANSMLYSSVMNREVRLPIDGNAYERMLKGLIKRSRPRKRKKVVGAVVDMSQSRR